MNKYILCQILSGMIAAVSQILLKISANKNYDNVIREYLNVYVITSYGMLGFSLLLTVYALKGVELSLLAILESLSYIYVPILCSVVLKEKLNIKEYVGMVIIIIGIIVYALG